MKVIGIDIGSYSVKVAEVDSNNQSIKLVGFKEIALSTDPQKDRDIEVIEALRQIAAQYANLTDVNFVAGLSASRVSVHRLVQPPAPRFKLLESIPYVLSDISPLDPEDSIYDIRTLKTHPNGHDIIAVAAQKENIKKRLQMFSDGGIEASILSVQGLTVNNVFEDIYALPVKDPSFVEFDDFDPDEKEEQDEEQASKTKNFAPGEVVLVMGHTSTNMIVRKEGDLAECREISWSGHDLILALCDEYKIHYHEALQMLHKSGILILKEKSPSPDLNRLSKALKKAMVPLLKELQISLLEVKSKYTLQVRAIGLLGGASKLRNLGPYLTQKLQIACNPVSNIHQFPELDFKAKKNTPIAHMTALGLALEGLRKPRNPALDFRKQEFTLSNENLKVFFEKWSYTLQLVACAFFVVLAWSALRSRWSYELSDLALDKMKTVGSRTTGFSRSQSSVPRLSRYIKNADQRMATLKKLESFTDYKQASYFLRQLHAKAPGRRRLKIDITSLNIDNKTMKISGLAEGTAQLLGLEGVLKELARGNKIAERTIAEGGNASGKTPFTYVININPMP